MQHLSRHSATPDAVTPRARSAAPKRLDRLLIRTLLLVSVTALWACATLETQDTGAPQAQENAPADSSMGIETADRELAAGVALYDNGDYVQAIRSLLTSQWIWVAPLETRVTAQKYIAFSHCLLNRPKPCMASFGDLLKIKPDFELAAAEAGHPQWGAAFKQAKRQAASPTAPLKQSMR